MGSQTGTEIEGNSPTRIEVNGPQRESKLEFFGFDSLVNILGLKRYNVFSLPATSVDLFNASERGPFA